MNNIERYRLARFTVSPEIDEGRPYEPVPVLSFVSAVLVVFLALAVLF